MKNNFLRPPESPHPGWSALIPTRTCPMSRRTSAPRSTCSTLFLLLVLSSFTTLLPGAELKVDGLGWLDNRRAEQKLKIMFGGDDAPADAGVLEDAALVLISALNGQGYLESSLTVDAVLADGGVASYPLNNRLEPPLPRPLAASSATLRFDRGRRYTLEEITFTGLFAMKADDARAFFVGESALIPLASERIYAPGRLQRSAGNLEEALRQLGYAEATVTPGEPRIDRATGEVRVAITVKEGRRWLVHAVEFKVAAGAAPPDEAIAGRTGRPWNTLWRQDAMTAIRRWYYGQGHPDVRVKLTPRPMPAADGTNAVSVLAEITPGPVIRLGEVRFAGNNHTREQTLRRLVRSDRGDLLDPVRMNNSQARISRLGVFRTVDLRYEPAGEGVRDAVFDLVEGRRQEVNLFGGYGSYEQLRGGVEWRHYNLFDRAHTDSLKLVQSMKSSSGDYTYTVPSLFGTRTSGSARLFGLRREELSFTHEEYGANVTLLWPLRRLGYVATTGYTFRHLRNADSQLGTQATDQNQADIASFELSLLRDRRDNPLRPRKGYRLSLQAETASRTLGGEVDYQQFVFSSSYHTPWGKGRWVHAGFSHGVVTTLGAPAANTLPVSVLFYPGGENSIRGFQKGEAAPRDATGRFIGAKSYLQFNLELEQTLGGKWSAVLFGDALGTSATLRRYPSTGTLYSVGLGVRYQTIIGPLRLEYGHNLNPRPLDPDGTLLFSIGYPF